MVHHILGFAMSSLTEVFYVSKSRTTYQYVFFTQETERNTASCAVDKLVRKILYLIHSKQKLKKNTNINNSLRRDIKCGQCSQRV